MSHLLYLHTGQFDALVGSLTPEFLRRRLAGRESVQFAEELSGDIRGTQLDYAKIGAHHHETLNFVVRNLDGKRAGRPISPWGISEKLLNAFEPRFLAEKANNARLAMLYGKRPGMPSLRAPDRFEFLLLPPSDLEHFAEIVTRVASNAETLACRGREQSSFVEVFASEIVRPTVSAAERRGSFLFGRWS